MELEPNTNSASTPVEQKSIRLGAWQPFTPRGVAAFAGATYARVFILQVVVALLATATTIWFLKAIAFPVVGEGLRRLPDKGAIVNGELNWPREPFEILQERRPFLAFLVDLDGKMQSNGLADLSVQFRKRVCQVCSPFGCAVWPYPKDYQIEFNRPELEPRWDAWVPIIIGWTVVGVPLLLYSSWGLLAALYFLPAWLLGYYTNRDLSLGGSWRLSLAGLMPGAVLLTASIVLYGSAIFDLLHLLTMLGVHIVVGWVYVVCGVLARPRLQAALSLGGNPFQTEGVISANRSAENKPESPFAGPDQPPDS